MIASHPTPEGAATGTAPAAPQAHPIRFELRERIAAAHDASLDDDHRACRDLLITIIKEIDAAGTPAQEEPAVLTDEQIIGIRKGKRWAPSPTAPWQDSIQFARAVLTAAQPHAPAPADQPAAATQHEGDV